MKKVLMILAAICMTMAANAKILRVSNVSGSSAPYKSIEAAQDAASAGDTIMVEGSKTTYGDAYGYGAITLTKRVVLIGPGYWLAENGIINEGGSAAVVGDLTIKVSNTVIKGMTTRDIEINASHVVINRCQVTGGISFAEGADNAIISQNFIKGNIGRGNGYVTNYHQITNNILTDVESNQNYSTINRINDCTVAYNTFRDKTTKLSLTNSKIEHNIWKSYVEHGSSNNLSNNYEIDIINTQATNDFIDTDYYNLEIPAEVISQYGAFAGDSPYVISGVPSGPIITNLEMPTTVEVGSTPTVTIKVSISK